MLSVVFFTSLASVGLGLRQEKCFHLGSIVGSVECLKELNFVFSRSVPIEELYIMKKAFLILELMTRDALMTEAFMPFSLESRHILPTRDTNWHGSFSKTANKGSILGRAVSDPDCKFTLIQGNLLDRWFDFAHVSHSTNVGW